MAELNLGKGLTAGKVASNVQKKLTRAQEKVRVTAALGGGLQARRLRSKQRWRILRRGRSVASPHYKQKSADAVVEDGGGPLQIGPALSQCHAAGTHCT